MAKSLPPITIFTLGHSDRPIEDFIALLQNNQIKLVADVRAFPASRNNPQYQQDVLVRSLKPFGICYQHFPNLGGRRRPVENSPNTGWINKSFQGYADYMRTESFKKALHKLISLAREMSVVIVCAEAVPWRCHRNLIADALVARGIGVEHILSSSRNRAHRLTLWAKLRSQTITYPRPNQNKAKQRKTMPKTFRVGDRVSWNSEAGRVRGRIVQKITRATRFKGDTHYATPDDPQYMIESEKTGHIALHRAAALRMLPKKKSTR